MNELSLIGSAQGNGFPETLDSLNGDIQGISNAIGNLGRKKERKEKRKGKVKGGKVKKVALAPARAAFLVLARLNIKNVSTKLAQAENLQPGSVKDVWEKKLGGKWSVLKRIIQKASKISVSGMGQTGAEVAAAIAAAAPVLAVIAGFLKKLSKKDKTGTESAEEGKENKEGEEGKEKDAGNGITAKIKALATPRNLFIGGGVILVLVLLIWFLNRKKS